MKMTIEQKQEVFERWATFQRLYLGRELSVRTDAEQYESPMTQTSWVAWQAAFAVSEEHK
jgi:hypothetical protein